MKNFLWCLLLAGCGSSGDPRSAAVAETGVPDAATETPPSVAPRTLETAPLLPFAPQNLILDWTFRETGWGSFLILPVGATAPASVPVRTFTDSPGRASAPVALLKDPTGTDEKSKALTATCVLVGGKGPFDAGVWFSRSTFAGAPVEWDDTADHGTASITTDGPVKSGKSYPLKRTETRKVGERTWVRLEAHIDDSLATAFFVIQAGKNGALWVTAPSIVPVGLLPGPTTKSIVANTKPRPATALELEAIAAYARLIKPQLVPARAPVTFGPGKPRVVDVP